MTSLLLVTEPMMNTPLNYLLSLSALAEKAKHRYLVRLKGDEAWQTELISGFLSEKQTNSCSQLGGTPLDGVEPLTYKQGGQLLGLERECLIYDDRDSFDANSFTAASGALRGGGLLFLLLSEKQSLSYQMLEQHLSDVITLVQGSPLPTLPNCCEATDHIAEYSEQKEAIVWIKKVWSGHRKRPLVLTADRGRGKSSALGIAAAEMINQKTTRILVTAPSRKAVEPVFSHAKKQCPNLKVENKNCLVAGQSWIKFVSPDELLLCRPECDLLMVDEAAAIPIPLLIDMASRYHRTVFSSTIHGYEGCGRGFTLKFVQWLKINRPGYRQYHIQQPIRWSNNDPLETWVFNTFLLNSELSKIEQDKSLMKPNLERVDKQELIRSPLLFRQCIALLINAHYQTTPNDLFQLLDDPAMELYAVRTAGIILGCVITKTEGELEESLIKQISLGRRRPKGHLAPVIIAGMLGIEKAAKVASMRVLRIAVTPSHQGVGLGSEMLTQLKLINQNRVSYISTSYGVTQELLAFWLRNDYVPLRLGSSRDQASGTHSLLMVQALEPTEWLDMAYDQFYYTLISLLAESFKDISAQLAIELVRSCKIRTTPLTPTQAHLIKNYVQGGNAYESVLFPLSQCLADMICSRDVHPILVSKLWQKKSWTEIAGLYQLSGRKQAEQFFRESIGSVDQFTV